jgi:hypothetical protein
MFAGHSGHLPIVAELIDGIMTVTDDSKSRVPKGHPKIARRFSAGCCGERSKPRRGD